MSCPEPDQLARFADNALPDVDRLAIEDHIRDCEKCRQRTTLGLDKTLAPAVADTVIGQGANPLSASPTPEIGPGDAGIAATLPGGPATQPDGAAGDGARQLAPGAMFDRYQVRDVLGAGGMGVVYAARDTTLDRDVAIKVLRPDFARRDPEAARRIVHEARVMARISHPNVLSVFDVGMRDGQVYIAMELASSGTLRAWMDRGQHSIGEILEVFVAAGNGLIAAHDAGVVHRDFKPDNVLIGKDGRVRVTDFGLAHDYVAPSGRDPTGQIAGTPGYMAPEQFEGGSVDTRTDQFSFCAALYEAVCGTRPFSGRSFDELAKAVTDGTIDPPKSRVPASIHAILLRGLAVKPGDRFPTMADLLKALGRDRGRRPRLIAIGAAIALVAVGISFAADFILRDRMQAVTRTSFAATRAQVDRLVEMRTDAFVAQSDLADTLPALQAAAATVDQSDFGLGEPEDDRARLERLHDNLRSASWLRIIRMHPGHELAIADGKGRLLYGSARPHAWGNPITAVPAIAAAYGAAETSITVVRPGDPNVIASKLLGDRDGLYVVFARVKLEHDQPRLLFVQLVPSSELIREVRADEELRLSVVAPDGTVEGSVPAAVVRVSSTTSIDEVVVDGDHWLVQRGKLGVPGQRAGVVEIVLARPADVGLAGLFPAAREVLALLALALALTVAGGTWLARQRDLTKRRPEPARAS